jgi:ATP-binding cassette, subfamily B, bacterial
MPYGLGRVRFMNEDEQAAKPSWALLKRILAYFKPYRWPLALAVLIILVQSTLSLVPPLILRNIIDEALPNKDLMALARLVGLSVVATISINLLQVGQSYVNQWIAKHIVFHLKNTLYAHLQGMSLRYFTSAKPGDILTRLSSDVDGIQDIFNSTVVNALNSGFTLITTAAVLMVMNWKLGLLSLAVLPLFILPTRKVGKARWKIAQKSQEKISELHQIVQETLGISGVLLMKIFTKEADHRREFEATHHALIKLQLRETLVGRWFMMTIQIFMTIGPMLVYFYGGYLLIQGELTVGAIIAFVALLSRLYGPVTQLSNIHIEVTRSFALFGRIFEMLDADQEITDEHNAPELQVTDGRIVFDRVHFAYQPETVILHGISLTCEPGSVTALVGPSGAGKSTITNLIPRLFDIQSGSIRIDGKDIRSVSQQSLRAHIGVVPQEPYLFNASIADNLRYAKPDATDEALIAACTAAYIHDFISELPEGYNTLVGNRGIKLSGGEKQRLSIARVILKDPKIIIFDEATSSLDSLSEAYIQKAMDPLLKGRTAIVIAHRLSTVLRADHVIVLEKGNIVERGTHQSLLDQQGLYAQLYETQFLVPERSNPSTD